MPNAYDDIPPESLIDWMVFDLGNVILHQTASLPELARRIGAPADLTEASFRTAYNAPRRDYDQHSDAACYWAAVAAACGAPAPDATTIADLTALDVALWSRTDPDMLGLLTDLLAAGVRLAVLSNAPTAMGDHVRNQPWARPFEKIVISGEIGLLKPDVAIYRYLLDELGAPASRVAFADDLAENIAGAQTTGIQSMLFTGLAPLREGLAALGVRLGAR